MALQRSRTPDNRRCVSRTCLEMLLRTRRAASAQTLGREGEGGTPTPDPFTSYRESMA